MSREEENNCNPGEGIDWEEMDLPSIMGAAQSGVPGAVAFMEKLEKELALPIIDTVSDKSSNPLPIIEWIEE
jgi:hypothetical protein